MPSYLTVDEKISQFPERIKGGSIFRLLTNLKELSLTAGEKSKASELVPMASANKFVKFPRQCSPLLTIFKPLTRPAAF